MAPDSLSGAELVRRLLIQFGTIARQAEMAPKQNAPMANHRGIVIMQGGPQPGAARSG
tara:strand:- start:3039 stop:3212 length:174 start_codon:yes stop_codon:yes gene_type:complete